MFLLVGVSVRALMESAGESGYPVQGIDFFADSDSCRWGKTMSLMNDFGLAPSVELLLEVAQNQPCEGLGLCLRAGKPLRRLKVLGGAGLAIREQSCCFRSSAGSLETQTSLSGNRSCHARVSPGERLGSGYTGENNAS